MFSPLQKKSKKIQVCLHRVCISKPRVLMRRFAQFHLGFVLHAVRAYGAFGKYIFENVFVNTVFQAILLGSLQKPVPSSCTNRRN